MKLKKGDTILITGGKDKGKKGKIDAVLPKNDEVVVAGVNLYKKHMKKRDEKNPGGITEAPRPLKIGNIALICPHCGKPTRVGWLVSKNDKIRVCRKCGKSL